MQRYWWPGYERQLLRALQQQQNSAQFCDTLLQTEGTGISVPTHSCVLAALSPYLFQKLSASPPPLSGQKRQLQLEAVKAHTLLKLVGLLYSGELEVKEGSERNDVLSVAHQFGITDLAEGVKVWGLKEGELQEKSLESFRENSIQAESNERDESKTMQDVQVQRRDADSPVENTSYVSTGMQTVKAVETSEDSSVKGSGQAPTPESVSSVAQTLDVSVMLQPLNITLDKQICSTSCSLIPSVPTSAPADGESTLNRSSGRIINPKSTLALSRNVMTFPLSLNDDSDCPSNKQQLSEFGDNIQTLSKKSTGQEGGKINDNIADKREDSKQPGQACRDEISREEIGNYPEKQLECANVVMKSLSRMQQMLETTEISMKVKLRRGANGKGWEVVNLQDLDETFLITSRKQDGSKQQMPQTDHTCIQPPASTTELCTILKPETVILQPATTASPKTPPQPSTSSDGFTPNQSDALGGAGLPQPQSSVEESDEQIEKLLEDIMMGLNILPNLEGDCKKSDFQPSHDGVQSTCQVPVTQNDAGHSQMGAAVSATGLVFCQDLGPQSGNSSTDTGLACFTPQNQPYTRASSVQLTQQQQQQCSSQYHSSVRSMAYRDGLSCQNMLLTKSQECLQPEVPVARSVMPSAFFSAGQKLHYQAFQKPASQGNRILEFVPPMTGNDSLHTLFLPSMDDFHLPSCLSPIEQYTSATKHQAPFNNNAGKFHQQPSLHGRPWLTENPGLLQFPPSAIIRRKNKSTTLPQDTNFWTKQHHEHLKLNVQEGGIWPETCTVKKMEERGTICVGQQNAAELTSDPRKEEIEQGDTTRDIMALKRKRRNTSYPQDSACSLLTYKDKKICNRTKDQINLSVCSVSLSSNNVLAKEREMATSSSNIISRIAGKPSPSSSTTKSLREKTKRCRGNAARTQIRTRGILRTQKSQSTTTAENSLFPKPVAYTAEIVNEVIIPHRRKPGRPRKKLSVTQPKSNSAVTEKRNSVNNRQQMNKDLHEDDFDKGDKTKRKCKRRRNLSSEVEVIPLKRTISTESTDKIHTDNNNRIPSVSKPKAPKQSLMVTLEDFHKFIRLQHSKAGKSKEHPETQGTGRGAEGEGMTSGHSTFKESSKQTKTDIQPEDMGGSEESPVTVTVDKNHNKIFNKEKKGKSQQDDTDSSMSKEISVCTDDPVLLFDEETTKLAAKRDPPLRDPDEAGKSCDAGVSNTTQQALTNNEHLSRCDSDLSQEDKLVSVHNPETTGAPQLDTGGICRTSGCTQEEEGEVDVLLYTPDKVSQSRQWAGLHNVEITSDEEEEEDVYEVDVTGDEAE